MNLIKRNNHMYKEYDLKQILLDSLVSNHFELTTELEAYLEEVYHIHANTSFTLIAARLGHGFLDDAAQIEEGFASCSFEELNTKKIVLSLPLQQLVLCIIYPMDLRANYRHLQQRVQNEWSLFSPEYTIFVAEQCIGLLGFRSVLESMVPVFDWNLTLGSGVLLHGDTLANLNHVPLKYPSELDGEVEKALLQKNMLVFGKCFKKLLDHSRQELHTPSDIKSTCIRYALLIAHIDRLHKEDRNLVDVQRMMASIVNANYWLDIWNAVLEFAMPILKEEEKEKDHSLLVIEARRLISRYYNTGIGLEEIADKLHVTQEYLSTVIKKETGLTFSEIIRSYRINKVKQLLCTSDLKIHEIALLSGYSDGKYMSRVFRDSVGMSPSEYRNARPN